MANLLYNPGQPSFKQTKVFVEQDIASVFQLFQQLKYTHQCNKLEEKLWQLFCSDLACLNPLIELRKAVEAKFTVAPVSKSTEQVFSSWLENSQFEQPLTLIFKSDDNIYRRSIQQFLKPDQSDLYRYLTPEILTKARTLELNHPFSIYLQEIIQNHVIYLVSKKLSTTLAQRGYSWDNMALIVENNGYHLLTETSRPGVLQTACLTTNFKPVKVDQFASNYKHSSIKSNSAFCKKCFPSSVERLNYFKALSEQKQFLPLSSLPVKQSTLKSLPDFFEPESLTDLNSLLEQQPLLFNPLLRPIQIRLASFIQQNLHTNRQPFGGFLVPLDRIKEYYF